jgi:hypothetical protein
MPYISSVASKWPILRIGARIIVAFCCAVPLAWFLSNLIAHELRSFIH